VKETLVYRTFIIWSKFDEDNRKTELPDLLQCVKFEKLSEKFCSEIISQEDLITNNFQCMKVVFQGFSQKFYVIGIRDEKSILIGFAKNRNFKSLNLNKKEIENNCIPDLPISLADYRLLQLNDVVFCIGGISGNISSRHDQWHEIAAPNEVADRSSAAVFKDTLVVAGGFKKGDASYDKTRLVEIYCNALNQWHRVSLMKEARRSFELVNCEGYLYAIGGLGNNGYRYLSAVERLSGFDSKWEYVHSMITARQNHATVSYKECIYVFGGESKNGLLRSVECIYVFGGESKNGLLRSVEKYDPALNKWAFVGDMSTERSGHTACVINGKIHLVGGIDANNKFVTAVEIYDPFEESWNVVAEIDAELSDSSFVAI